MLASTFSTRFAELMDRLGERFCRRDLLRQAESYLRGLLSHIQRKNSWQLAEATGAETRMVFSVYSVAPVGMPMQCVTISGATSPSI